MLTLDTKQVLVIPIPQCKHSVSSESRHSHSMSTPDIKQVLTLHSIHVSVSNPDTDHSVSTSDTNRMQVETSFFFPLLCQLTIQGIAKSQPNTKLNFQAFNSTIGIKLSSLIIGNRSSSTIQMKSFQI